MNRTRPSGAPRSVRAGPSAVSLAPAACALWLLVGVSVARAEVADVAPQASQPAAGAAANVPAAAPAHTAKKNGDPFEKVNRATYAFNDALDRMLARPVAKAYRRVVPEPGRVAISNVLSNFEYPETLVNSALQGKFKDASQDLARFVVNSTIGIGGLWDPATKFGLPRHDEDFGQTLGKWGVPPGPYVVLPLLGPSDLRDGPSKFVDRYANVPHYVGAGNTEYYILGVGLVDKRAELLATDAALDTAFDPYALVRNAYLQRRQYLVTDGQIADEPYDEPYEEPMDDGSAPAEAAPAPAATPATDTPAAAPTPRDAPTTEGAP
jgi:phospholipid-binding lipoprotein MlaA